ncbi:hypothetical protein [Halostreptopolyspora alba]|uniref:hypothetical protein n=1 Tax=Halostreptopolyspora alba TaxID=2487137 RepID=UPI003712F658
MDKDHQQWEYKLLTVRGEGEYRHRDEFNQQGREGWQVTGVVPHGQAGIRYVLTRPKS